MDYHAQGKSMNMQNSTIAVFSKFFTVISLTVVLAFTVSAKPKQQQVLLDANGNPLSYETLLLLSSSASKFGISNNKPEKRAISKKAQGKKKSLSDPILEKELFETLKAGQTARVKHLLKTGVKPTYKNHKGETPLGIAVTRGWASMIIQLVESGADIHEKGARGVTLIHTASSRGLTDVVKLLVKYGLNPGRKTNKNWTPLHVAARYGHWQLVQYFVQIGINPDIRNSDGKTALGLARHLRHTSVIKILSPVTTVRSLEQVRSKKKRKKRKK